jgi:hypothetical protein
MYYEKEKSMGGRADDQQPARTMTKPKETFTMPTAPFGGQHVILPVFTIGFPICLKPAPAI